MDYELGYINQLYDVAVQHEETAKKKSSAILKELKEECARILTLMLHSKQPEEICRAMILRHQRSIYLLLNSIEEKTEEIKATVEKQSQTKTDLLENFSKALQELSGKIREHFPGYIDPAHPLSLPELKATAKKLAGKLEKISTKDAASEQALIALLRSTISQTNLINIKTSYYQAAYLNEVLDNLLMLEENQPNHTHERYINILIGHGFNAPNFYSYCCLEIIKKMDTCQDMAGSYRELFWIKKRLEQLIPYTDQSFYRSLPEIKSSLLNFIQAEINHLNNLEKIAGELAGGGKIQENFKVSLSVKELAFFIHLQVECGVIIEDKPKKVHEYVVGHYSTKETTKISEKSFKNAYYSHTREDMTKVTTKLAEMLARAQQKT